MFDICFYSGLPFCCELCPEENASCHFNAQNALKDLEKKGVIKDGRINIPREDLSFNEYIKKEFCK